MHRRRRRAQPRRAAQGAPSRPAHLRRAVYQPGRAGAAVGLCAHGVPVRRAILVAAHAAARTTVALAPLAVPPAAGRLPRLPLRRAAPALPAVAPAVAAALAAAVAAAAAALAAVVAAALAAVLAAALIAVLAVPAFAAAVRIASAVALCVRIPLAMSVAARAAAWLASGTAGHLVAVVLAPAAASIAATLAAGLTPARPLAPAVASIRVPAQRGAAASAAVLGGGARLSGCARLSSRVRLVDRVPGPAHPQVRLQLWAPLSGTSKCSTTAHHTIGKRAFPETGAACLRADPSPPRTSAGSPSAAPPSCSLRRQSFVTKQPLNGKFTTVRNLISKRAKQVRLSSCLSHDSASTAMPPLPCVRVAPCGSLWW